MIIAKNLMVSFGNKIIIEKSNFLIKDGEKVGIIGNNGSGKTTLLKCIAGLQEYHGEIILSSKAKIGYQEQDIMFSENSTLLQEYKSVFSEIIEVEKKLKELEKNITNKEKYEQYLELLEKYEQNNKSLYKKKIKSTILGLGFKEEDIEKPFKYFSGGELVKAAIGKVILKEPDILLLDEPSNHLDIDSIEWLERFIRSLQSTVIIVSHDKYFLNRITNKILEIEFGKVYQYNGNYDKYLILKENFIKTLEKKQKNLIKEIKRTEEIIQRLKSYGREKHIKQALSRSKKLEKLNANLKKIEKEDNINIKMEIEKHMAKKVLVVSNVEKTFSELLFKNVSFEIQGGEKVGLIGPNGCGKSTLLKMIIGKEKYKGRIYKGYNIKIGYYDQKLQTLNEDYNVFENLKIENPELEDYKVRKILGNYLFKGEDVFKKINELSGGEKARLALAKILIHQPNFLILDEPTNHLDITSREIITHSLKNFYGSILLVSHDRYLLDSLCEKILVLNKNGIVAYLGNFSYYYEKKFLSTEKNNHSKNTIKKGKIIHEKKKKLRKIKSEIKKKEEYLKELEEQLETIEKEIDKLYNSITEFNKINNKLEEKKKIEELYLKIIEEIDNLKNIYEREKI